MLNRTEKVIKRVAKELGILTTITLIPGRVLISFQEDLNFAPTANFIFSTASDDLVVVFFIVSYTYFNSSLLQIMFSIFFAIRRTSTN